ncbi:MAG: 6-phosphogluconolactonase [Spirochaetales bacterium]|nr:6-phosphogluconolactonase [Spirochaetales bacterium]
MKKNVFENADLAAQALARFVAGEIGKKNGLFYLAVSGGSTPARLFSLLTGSYRDVIDWEKIRLFWVDERCVPPGHGESNYGMTRETLLDHVAIPGENVFRMKGEEEPALESHRYGELIKRTVPLDEGIPVFDMVLLGMGDDGHTASVFPDQIHLMDSRKICEVAVHPVSGQKRITITGPVINKGRKVIFFLTGAGKKTMLEKIFQQDQSLPASLVQPESGGLYFFLDKAADPA